jgi:membrane protease subunit (stomatin/prohibitin family)
VWGTDSPIDLADPKYSMLVGVRANGQTAFRIADSRRFIVKVAGMMNEYTADTLKKTIKGLIMAPIKECIAQTIIENRVSILEITPRLTEISEKIQEKLNARIGDLGIAIEHFNVNSITAKDGDLDALRKAKADMLSGMNVADIEAYKMQVLSEARAKARQVEGYTYAEERKFDVLEEAAKNDSGSNFVNMGVGLGVGTGLGQEIGKMASSISSQPSAPTPAAKPGAVCANCGEAIPDGAKFCMNCGTPRPVARFCPQCGAKAGEGAKFCMECGTKLG